MKYDALIRSYREHIAKTPLADHSVAEEEIERLRELQRQLRELEAA